MGKLEKVVKKGKRFSCFTPEEQLMFDGLDPKHRAYVEFRARGYSKTEAYRLSGWEVKKTANQCAYILERRKPELTKLIEKLSHGTSGANIMDETSGAYKELEKKARKESEDEIALKRGKGRPKDSERTIVAEGEYTDVVVATEEMPTVQEMDLETAKRVLFYRQISEGKIKTVKVKKKYNVSGVLLEKVVEEIDDVDTRIKARKELDRLLGLSAIVELGSIQASGDITINIVDASKKEEVEDERNKPLEMKTEIIDGQEVLVVEEEDGKEKQ